MGLVWWGGRLGLVWVSSIGYALRDICEFKDKVIDESRDNRPVQ